MINAKVAEAFTTEKEIDVNRELYRPVAFHVSILYFCISDLSIVDPMYQFSLQWFTNLFVQVPCLITHRKRHAGKKLRAASFFWGGGVLLGKRRGLW